MRRVEHLAAILTVFLGSSSAVSQSFPQRIPSAGGEIVIADKLGRKYYDEGHYAPARRAGDYVYISGVVMGGVPGSPRTPETFKQAARAGFARLKATLAAFGLTFEDVVMMNSFHDLSAPEFHGDRVAQFAAFEAIKDEMLGSARPAWTAVGTSGLYREEYVVEVQMIAYAPQRGSPTTR